MNTLIIGDSSARVWGMSGAERLRRQFADMDHVVQIARVEDLSDEGPVLLLRGDHLFDPRLLHALAGAGDDMVLCAEAGGAPVAARVRAKLAPRVRADLAGEGSGDGVAGLLSKRPSEIVEGFQESLRKTEAPQLLAITGTNTAELETELFGGAYKGVTDLITKWLWPVPALHATRLCVRLGLLPNHVTLFGLALAVVTLIAFWTGNYGLGLATGWFMTFLDTVDGKLARVTVTASRFGDVLDHGIDLLHPPLWYMAWGFGLGERWTSDWSVVAVLWLMLAGYLGGRLCEGAFQLFVAPFSIFVWRPIDSLSRLVTARRNPNLILLTGSWLVGREDLGLWWIAIWHLFSTIFLALRVGAAWFARRRHGPQEPWLVKVDPVADRHGLAVRIFTRASRSPGDDA